MILLQRCEDDTRRLLGHLAAERLGNWRKHTSSETNLVEYVQQLLWGEHCANGRKLDRRGGLSVERIVLDHVPDCSRNRISSRRSAHSGFEEFVWQVEAVLSRGEMGAPVRLCRKCRERV